MIYNHRDFWTTGHGAKGLDPAILTPQDSIQYDDGTTIPAYARLTYGPGSVPFGPHRELTDGQATVVELRLANRRYPAKVHEVDQSGIARVVCTCGHYAPIVYRVWPSGYSERVDAPYGDGEREYGAVKAAA